MLLVIGQIKEILTGDAQAIGARQDVRCNQIVIPPYLILKFEKLAIDAKPGARSDDTFPMHDAINAFLQHYEDEAAAARISRSRGFQPPSPTEWHRQYVCMMRSIWIIQRIESSAEYVDSCERGNQLLKHFVDDLAKKCLYVFNQHSDRPANPRKVKNEPDEVSLDLLGEETFRIWPIAVPVFDRPHATEIDDMKTILRAPLLHVNSERQRSLVLLRQTETVLEMITKETSVLERTRELRSQVSPSPSDTLYTPKLTDNIVEKLTSVPLPSVLSTQIPKIRPLVWILGSTPPACLRTTTSLVSRLINLSTPFRKPLRVTVSSTI